MSYLDNRLLLTDLYQLTMLQSYFAERMEETAAFEFFVRRLHERRNFLMAAGLEPLLNCLEQLRLEPAERDWLARDGRFRTDFLDYLAELRFTGDVHAMHEGTIFFADEPIVRITAPLPQAQLIESRLINLLHFQTLIASKAARTVLVARGRPLVEFGMRRAHGGEASTLAARACYIAGFAGTATVTAGAEFDIPLYGTMAHSFIQAHDDEAEAFVQFGRANPSNVVLLLDTYDTERGARRAVAVARRLEAEGIHLRGVRIDSGDLAEHARHVRRILDEANLRDVTIFVSGNLDEYAIAELQGASAPIDAFGVGTRMVTSADAPYLDCAYKLQEYAGTARRKRSEGKSTWPGRKQVFRQFDPTGRMLEDTLTLDGDTAPGEPLIEQVMTGGRRLRPAPTLAEIRGRAASQLAQLPDALRDINQSASYHVHIAPTLKELADEVDQRQ